MGATSTSIDWREFDPDILTICPPRKRRADRVIKSGADLFPKEQGGIFGMMRAMTRSEPPKPLTTDEPTDFESVWQAMWLVRHRLLQWRLLDSENSVRLFVHKAEGPPSAEWSERRETARKAWERAVEAMLAIPSQNELEHSHKRNPEQVYYGMRELREMRPQWAKLIDEERARLDAEKAQRRAARAAKKGGR